MFSILEFLGMSPATGFFVAPIFANAFLLLATLFVWAIHDYFYRESDESINRRTQAYASSLPPSVRYSIFALLRELNDAEIEDLYTVPSVWTCLKSFALLSIPGLSYLAFLVFGAVFVYTVAKLTLLAIGGMIPRKFKEIAQAPLF